MAVRWSKDDFRYLDIPNLFLINVHAYHEFKNSSNSIAAYSRSCEEILFERWKPEWIPYETVITNIDNKQFFDFGSISGDKTWVIWKILDKEFWKGW